MRLIRYSGCVLYLTAVLAVHAQNPPTPALNVTFQASSVVVTGITPGAQVYGFSSALEPHGGYSALVDREITLSDDHKSGRVEWSIDRTIPLRSVWLLVDLTNGTYGAVAPAQYRATHTPLTDRHLRKDTAGNVTQLSSPGSLVEFVVIRPGGGTWSALVADGGALDEDSNIKLITISTSRLSPRSGTRAPAPGHLNKNDVVFIMDPFKSTFGAIRIGE